MGKRKTLGARVGRECVRKKGQGGEWGVVAVELTFMPNVLVLLLSVREGSPVWEGKGGKWVRGWAERSKTCIRLVLLGALRPAWTDSEDVGNGLRLSAEAAWTSLRGSLWCSPGEAPSAP